MSQWKREEERKTCVRAEFEVAGAALDVLVDRVVKMAVEDLLGKGERTVEARKGVRRGGMREKERKHTAHGRQQGCPRYADS